MRRRIFAPLLAATLAVTALVGCDNEPSASPTPGPASAGAAAFPVTVGTLTLNKQPTHIVSLAPTGTEMLYAVGAGAQVIAVDDQSSYPTNAPKTDLSGFQPNVEAVAKYQPDLVVLSDDRNDIVKALTALKIPVYQMPAAKTLDDTYRQINDLGALTGHRDEATSEVTQIKESLAKLVKDIPARSKPLTYYYELGTDLYSVTSKTFIGSLFSMAGLKNIADASDPDGKAAGYPQLSAEVIVNANPDLIFLADTKCCQQSLATLKARPGWAGMSAVSQGRVIVLDDDIASRWGPRVVDLLKAITDAVAAVPAA